MLSGFWVLSYKSVIPYFIQRDTPPQNKNIVINHLPPCRSKPIKALFVFGTQFKIFWIFCDCPIDCIVNCIVKVHKSMKRIIRIVHLPSVVQSEFNEETRTVFMRKENKTTILFNNSSPLVQRSAILENICWTQAAYALVCQLRHFCRKGVLVASLNSDWTTDLVQGGSEPARLWSFVSAD